MFVGMFPNVQNSNLQPDAGSETSVFANRQVNLVMKRNRAATIAIHISVDVTGQMQLQKVLSDDKTQFRK